MAISYRQRGKKKTWDYRIFDKNKKVVASNSGFQTKKEAILEASKIELELLNGNVIDSNISLYQLWQKWYNLQIVPLNKSQGTIAHHKHRGKLILDYFKDKSATNITYSEYQEFINEYAKRVGKDTVRRLNAEVRKVIQFAKKDKLSIIDFTDGVVITGQASRKIKKEKAIKSSADYHKLLKEVKHNIELKFNIIDYLLFIQLKTGLRFGEVLGLTWDCVLNETQEIKTYRRYDPRKKEWRPAKTATSVRTIPVDSETLNVLNQLKEIQSRDIEQTNIKNKENHIFFDLYTIVPSNHEVNKRLREHLKKLKLKPLDLSATGIRHTYASIMLGYGIDIWVIASNMGHKDITQITQPYGHLIKEKEESENKRVRELLSQ